MTLNGDDPEIRVGDIVALDGSKPALRPCKYCGSTSGRIDDPKGPHGFGTRCLQCNRHLGWLPSRKDKPAETAGFDLIE